MPTREAKATLPTSRQSQNCRRRREETLELSLPSIPRGPQPTSQARASSPRRPQLQIVGDDVGRLSHRHRRPPRPFATTTQASRSLIFSPTPQELYGPPAVVRLISSPGAGSVDSMGSAWISAVRRCSVRGLPVAAHPGPSAPETNLALARQVHTRRAKAFCNQVPPDDFISTERAAPADSPGDESGAFRFGWRPDRPAGRRWVAGGRWCRYSAE